MSVADSDTYEEAEEQYMQTHPSMRWGVDTPTVQATTVVIPRARPPPPARAEPALPQRIIGAALHSVRCCAVRFNAATCPGMFRGPAKFRLSFYSKVYMVVSLVFCAFLLAVCVAVLVKPGSDTDAVVYPTLGLMCTVAFLYFTVEAVTAENMFQFICSVVCTLIITLFVCFSTFKHSEGRLGPIWHRERFPAVAITLVFQVALLALAYPTADSFGFYVYKVAGADVRMQTLYRRYLSFLSLVKFDCFVSLLLVVMANFFLKNSGAPDLTLGGLSVIITLVFAFVAWFAVTRELLWLMAVFFVLSLYKPAYLAWHLYKLEVNTRLLPPGVTYLQFAIVGGVSIIVRVVLLVVAYQLMRRFRTGLRDRVFLGKVALTTSLLPAVQAVSKPA